MDNVPGRPTDIGGAIAEGTSEDAGEMIEISREDAAAIIIGMGGDPSFLLDPEQRRVKLVVPRRMTFEKVEDSDG